MVPPRADLYTSLPYRNPALQPPRPHGIGVGAKGGQAAGDEQLTDGLGEKTGIPEKISWTFLE